MIARIQNTLAACLLTTCLGLASNNAHSSETDLRAIAGIILELERELLIAERKLQVPNANELLTIYIDVADIPQLQIHNIQIQLDGIPIVNADYEDPHNNAFKKGGIQKVYQKELTSGAHEVQVSFSGEMSETVIDSKVYRFEKSAEAETLTITLIDILRTQEPELIFHYARSIKQ